MTLLLCWGQRHLRGISGLPACVGTSCPKPFPLCPSCRTPVGARQGTYSSERFSVPSCSIKAAKCLRSSLSAPGSPGEGSTSRTLRDPVFRRRCSLAAVWELRNCPADRYPKSSVPSQGTAKPDPRRFPLHSFNNEVQGEPRAESCSWGQFILCHTAKAAFHIPQESPGTAPGSARAALTEPGRELLCAQAPGASGIQPIKHQLQLLPAARQTFLLQALKPKQIRGKTHLSHPGSAGPQDTAPSSPARPHG